MNNLVQFRVFVDSDVVISSLISSTGAAYTLLNDTGKLEFYISNISNLELVEVADRLNLGQAGLQELIDSRLSKVELTQSNQVIKDMFKDYVKDIDDAHIVGGAKAINANFLISYNVRHFDVDKLRQDFQVSVLSPGLFLQYLRSL